ncbi:hypothetical protein HWV62_36709 [Athelia sp. TMB]|nr:hypothetical protein HWV62_38084 [Athelia sp. TMB]KAF7966853.1 hypothetical protein HWV62_36709 [Athelia sp. TMB]
MLFKFLATLSLLVASAAASPTPVIEARAAKTTIYMRIEGPTKTIYEKTIVATPKAHLTSNGHTAPCNGPSSAPGVTSLVALAETGQFFESTWTGTTFGEITKLNGTSKNANQEWVIAVNNIANGGKGGIPVQNPNNGDYCGETVPNLQHLLYAFINKAGGVEPLIMSGPKTASVGETVQYEVPYAPAGTYVNDLSVDTTTGQRVHATFGPGSGATASVSIKFTKKGTYNMKAHCASTTNCLRSNHVVTVVS